MTVRKTLYTDANGDFVESIGVYETTDYLNSSAGVGDAGKPIVLNGAGKIDATMLDTSIFNGLDWKQSARVATVAAVDLASAPSAIDGVTLSNGDRVIVKDGSTVNPGVSSIDNGIYVFNGAATAMTRATDADEDSEVTSNLTIFASEGTVNADRIYTVVTNDPIVVGTNAIKFEVVPFNTFSGGNGIDITSGVISVDLLDAGSGLTFAGGGSDELAIDFATSFTIDSADQLAFKASDLSSTANAKGAAIVGVEDSSAYYTANNLEGVLNELEAQLGGDTSSTFNFAENNVLADNDAVYSALNKLDLKFGDLASTANGEGASLVGIEDAAGNFVSTDVEGALIELHTLASVSTGEYAAAGTGGVSKGDLLYYSANNTVLPLSIVSPNKCVGIALSNASVGTQVRYARWDELVTGVLVGATAGDRYFWNGSALTTTLPSVSGQYVWQAGIAKNATDLLATVEFIKKNI